MNDEKHEQLEEFPRDAKEAMLFLEKRYPKQWGGPLYEVAKLRKRLNRIERTIAEQRAKGCGSERLDAVATKVKAAQQQLDRLQVRIEEDRKLMGL